MNLHRLIVQTVCSLIVCVAGVMFCYYYVDQPVALWVRDQLGTFDWLLKMPDIVAGAVFGSPLLILWLVVRRHWRPWGRWEVLVLALAVNIILLTALKSLLKWVFGRPSPILWMYSPQFLLDGGGYDFNWFHGQTTSGLPSGHTIVVCAVASMVWWLWPKWRWLAVLAVLTITVCLLVTDYHFVGDIVAGGCLGWLGGLWTVYFLLTQFTADLPADSTVNKT